MKTSNHPNENIKLSLSRSHIIKSINYYIKNLENTYGHITCRLTTDTSSQAKYRILPRHQMNKLWQKKRIRKSKSKKKGVPLYSNLC